MKLTWNILFLVFSIIQLVQHNSFVVEAEENKNFLNEWLVEIEGGQKRANEVAVHHGFHVERQLRSFPNYYLLKKVDVPHRSKRGADHHTKRLSEDPRVKFVEQQDEKIRVKRDAVHRLYNRDLAGVVAKSTGKFNDPEFGRQWYMNSKVSRNDMNIQEAWKMGLSGKGVVATILDDGIEKNHPDLAPNYNKNASYDFNDNDDDPSPRYEITNENKHGTRCGGEIAMVANNNFCGAGIAFNAGIGGVRILDGRITDHLEGDSLGFCSKNVDISSASWGPNDDGKTLEGPGKLAAQGILNSIKEGRDGKGAIMVWAAGNGAMYGDNCNCDGYASSIYTLTVSSASEHGAAPWYSEKCASTLAATYSSGQLDEKKIISADLHGKCTREHTGTSAAAPMAAGIIALVLERNPNLTWRDVQHLVVHTSRYEPLKGDRGWYRNGVDLCVNHAFGFGLMDAGALVKAADPSEWKPVGKQNICSITKNESNFPKELHSGDSIEVEIETTGCKGQTGEVNFLEHVQVILSLDYSKRGNIYIELESPMGTITPVMFERSKDKSEKGFVKWPLTSVHNWGEQSSGIWKLRVADRKKDKSQGELKYVELVLYGTKEKPHYYDRVDRTKCSDLDTKPTRKV